MKLLILSLFFIVPQAHAETWKIVTLDWPPYCYEGPKTAGVACDAFREAMKTVNVKIEYIFMPWTRGTYEVRKKEYVGLFPVWAGDKFAGSENSQALFSSAIGFVHNKKHLHLWKKLEDFKGLNIGIVENYGYPGDLLPLGKKGLYNLKEVATDEQVLRMVSFNRIDLGVVDIENARYIAEIRFPELQSKLFYDPHTYFNADLFVALKKNSQFSKHVDLIKQALKNYPLQERILENVKKLYAGPSQKETKKPSTSP